MSGGLPAVDMQDLARDECGLFEIQDPVDDIADLANPAEGVEGGLARVGCGFVQSSPDHSERDSVDPYAALRVLYCQRPRHGSQSALC